MKRTGRTLKERPAMFTHASTGVTNAAVGVMAVGTLWETLRSWEPYADVRPLLFLVGPRPGDGWAGWVSWRDGALPPGWRLDPKGHYLNDPESPVLRFVSPAGVKVEVRRWHSWVSDSDHTTAHDAASAWGALRLVIARVFGESGPALLASPAATGRDLWARLIPYGLDIPPCPTDVAELIRTTTTQGRSEVFYPERAERGGPWAIDSLCSYDARIAYLGSTLKLGYGTPVRGKGVPDPFDPYAHARYLVAFTVPGDWAWPGLLPVLTDDGWHWPQSGYHAGCWVGGAELWIAQRNGWQVRILEHIVWPQQAWDPLSEWTRKLTRSADMIAAERSLNDAVRRQAERAVRSIALHTIGAFVGRQQLVTRSGDLTTADVPGDATRVQVEGDQVTWQEDGTSDYSRQLAHPEWSAAVWERVRTKLATAPTGSRDVHAGFLSVSPAQLVGCRTDSLFLTADPRWPDDGRIGRYRRKLLPIVVEPQRWPRSPAGLLNLERHITRTITGEAQQ